MGISKLIASFLLIISLLNLFSNPSQAAVIPNDGARNQIRGPKLAASDANTRNPKRVDPKCGCGEMRFRSECSQNPKCRWCRSDALDDTCFSKSEAWRLPLQVSGSIALVVRGDCNFTTKAEVAQAGGAAGLIVINDDEGLVQMGCGNDTNLDIRIPVITISKSGGEELKKSMASGAKVELLLYSPNRPILDYSVIFLWLMAVGTIVFASLWSEITGSKQSDEHYDELSPQESGAAADKDDEEKDILHISAKSAIVFVITASTFLLLLYFFMSSWFIHSCQETRDVHYY